MVTKPLMNSPTVLLCLILAKNHMVTKLSHVLELLPLGLILAKNHMVTKRGTTITH